MRCPICGRPDNDAELIPREVKCGGCIGDLKGFLAAVDAKGARLYSNEQAVAEAVKKHRAREWAAHEALVGTGGQLVLGTKAKENADAAVAAVSK